MKTSLDTTVLVAGLHRGHRLHAAGLAWLVKAAEQPEDYGVCQHGLAEAYSVLTKAPPPIKVSAVVASQLLGDLKVTWIPLTVLDYRDAINRLAANSLIGGITNDMLHLAAAEAFGADRLVTANAADFIRLLANCPIEIVRLAD